MHFYLVDFENVPCKTVAGLQPGTCRIIVFLGANQQKLMLDLVKSLQPFGSDVEYVQIAGNGPNALDFHVAFYIGRLSQQFPGAEFTVVSKDTGFDPLIHHLAGIKVHCRREAIIHPAEATEDQRAKTKPASPVASKKVEKSPPAARPAAVKTTAPAQPKAPTTRQLVAEVLARLKSMKAAKPARLVTLTSSINSWFTPKLDQKQLDAVIQSLTDGKKIKVTGAKVAYALG
jgi:hypothetical protein